MNRNNWFAAVLGIGLALASPATAQSPAQSPDAPPAPATAIPPDQEASKEQLARLFEVMRIRQQMENLMRTMPAMVQQQVKAQMQGMAAKLPAGKQLTPEQQAAVDKLMDKYMKAALDLYPADEMLNDLTILYQRHLSRTDVDAFIVFYESAPGQHLLDAQPAIMREYMPIVMNRVRERSKTLNVEMTRDMQEMIKSLAPAKETPAQK